MEGNERKALEKDIKREKRHKKIILFLIAILIFLILSCGYRFFKMRFYIRGQETLGQARILRIGIQDLKYDYYARNAKMMDFTTNSGLKMQAYKELKELHDFSGKLKIQQWDSNGLDVKELSYTQGRYTAVYDADDQEGEYWKVYFNWRLD